MEDVLPYVKNINIDNMHHYIKSMGLKINYNDTVLFNYHDIPESQKNIWIHNYIILDSQENFSADNSCENYLYIEISYRCIIMTGSCDDLEYRNILNNFYKYITNLTTYPFLPITEKNFDLYGLIDYRFIIDIGIFQKYLISLRNYFSQLKIIKIFVNVNIQQKIIYNDNLRGKSSKNISV